jgi:FkbH-like protein
MDTGQMLQQVRADLPGFTFNDYLRHLTAVDAACSGGRPLRVAVLRSYTVEPLEPVLRLRLLLEGFRPTIWFGAYAQYVQEILDGESALYQFRPDVVLLLTRIDDLMPEFVSRFGSRTASEWEQAIRSKVGEIDALVVRLEAGLRATVFVQNMALAGGEYFGVFDSQQGTGQAHLIDLFNRTLAEALALRPGAFIWDFAGVVRAKGSDNLFDAKSLYTSRNPFKQSAYPALVDDLLRYVRSAAGSEKKCVVLDLDNTLWGGIAGEDGLDGIRLGHTYPGNCYREFQSALLRLYDRGILLALNSKNNEADAFRIIDEHPDMVLRRQHFAAARINWQDKAQNLRELARELNIGLDSMIFVDDNPAECELVRRECPECDVVQLPAKPYLLPAIPASLAGTEKIRLTEEDRRKGAMYQAQAERRRDETQYSNLDDFLRSLDVGVAIEAATAFSVPRIAQLTQKTNQMNMTTRRYSEAEIRAFTTDPSAAVFAVSSNDRFGDNGIIGVLILRFSAGACTIDTFLLSCRVIGRGIEQAMMAFIAEFCSARGIYSLVAEFFTTAKNQPAAGFYERCGLQRTGDTEFAADLRNLPLKRPAHIRVDVTVSPEGDRG